MPVPSWKRQERRAIDPEYRDRVNASDRRYKARQQAARRERYLSANPWFAGAPTLADVMRVSEEKDG